MIYERLLDIRKNELAISQEEMASELGVSFPAYRNYEKGTRELKVNTIERILKLQLKNGKRINGNWFLTGNGYKYAIEHTLLRKKRDLDIEESYKQLGKFLQCIQEKNKLFDKDIAEILDISESDYRSVSLGKKDITGKIFTRLLGNFVINPDIMFSLSNKLTPQECSGVNLTLTNEQFEKLKKLLDS